MRVLDDDLRVCSDCLMAIANGDVSGLDDEAREDVEGGLARLTSEGGYLCAGDAEHGFSWYPCHCCERALGGDRFQCILMGPCRTAIDIMAEALPGAHDAASYDDAKSLHRIRLGALRRHAIDPKARTVGDAAEHLILAVRARLGGDIRSATQSEHIANRLMATIGI